MLKLLILLSCTFATMAVFGQTTYVWTNQYQAHLNVNGGDMNQATNWNPNGVPTPMNGPDANGSYGDLLLFDGQTTGPLSVTEDGGSLSGFGGQSYPAGARIELTSNQTASVTIYSVVGLSGGLRMNWFSVDAPGSGGLILGDHSANGFDFLCGEQNGQIFGFTNNSTVPAVLNETVSFRCGGAGNHPMVFAGSGNWIVNNHMRSHNSSSLQVMMEGSGTFTWTGTNSGAESAVWYDKLGNPIRFDSGTTILKSGDLLNSDSGGPGIVNNGTLLEFDYAPGPGIINAGTIPGAISGTGPIQMNNGTNTLAGASTFTGNINLTGGELIAGSPESVGVSGPLGQDGIISFNGGTLGWNLANAFDYSPRFDTNAGQVYNLDTGASSPVLTAGLTSSGATLNKTGGGTLTLAGTNTYSGLTTVSAGTLLLAGQSGNGNITVDDGATLGVVENGTPFTPNTLTLGTLNGVTFEGNNVTNKSAAPMQPVNLASASTTTINVNSGRFRLVGDTFPLLAWSSGTPPGTSLNFLSGAGGHLVTNVNNKEIDLIIDQPPYIWTGATSGSWVVGGPNNWVYSGSAASWANGNFALFDDSLTANNNLTISGVLSGQLVTFDNDSTNYTLNSPDSSDNLGGSTALTMAGKGTLTLSGGQNTYTGITTVGGGIVNVGVLANGGTASDIGAASSGNTNIVLSGGGTLQYTGPGVTIDHLFSVGQGGGTIDNEGSGALVFTNAGPLGMSGNGPRALTLTGPNTYGDTLYCAIVNHPAGTSLTKNGTGTWILAGTNSYAGGTTLNAGILQVGVEGTSGTIGNGDISTVTGTTIDFERSGTLLVPGSIGGGAAVIIGTDATPSTNGTVILANNSDYTGGTTINAGKLQVGNGGGSGSLNGVGLIAVNNNALLDFNTSGSFVYGSGANGVISGTGNVSVRGGGNIKAIGANTYSGWTTIGANTIFQPLEGQDGGLVSSVVTNNGTLRLVRQDATIIYSGPIVGTGKLQIGANNVNVGTITLTGSNTFTGGIMIGGNTLILGDGVTPGAGAIPNNSTVWFTNNLTGYLAQDNARTLEFNRPVGDDFTFSGNIVTNFGSAQANLGIVQLQGGDTITLTGNNTYGGGTLVNAGQAIIGNGGASGAVGFGPVTLTSGTPLVINRTGNLAIPGFVSGSGGVTLINSATVSLSNPTNAYTGATTISNGTLVVSSLGGDLDVEGGTVVVQGTASAANLNVPGTMNIDSGTVVATLDPALSPSNTTYTVTGPINYTGGTLKLLTTGQTLAPGQYFKIFSAAVTGGAAMPIISPGCTVSNGLAVDGSVTVLSAQPLPTTLNFSILSRTNLVLSWAAPWAGGVHLQSQTDPRTNGLKATGWVTIPGSDAFSSYTNVINTAAGCVFYRMIIP